MRKAFGVLLNQETPQEILSTFSDYLHYWNKVPHFASRLAEQEGVFLSLEVLTLDKAGKPWAIQIPLRYILAIVDLSDSKNPIGFVS